MNEIERKIRVLITKSEQDCHDIGTRYIIKLLQDAGMEVIFTRYFMIDDVIKTALEEDVDVIGLSFYSAGLMYDTSRLLELMKENEIEDKPVILGGTIAKGEIEELLSMGVAGVFSPGRGSPEDIPEFIYSYFNS